jgi:hypothetical protein
MEMRERKETAEGQTGSSEDTYIRSASSSPAQSSSRLSKQQFSRQERFKHKQAASPIPIITQTSSILAAGVFQHQNSKQQQS